MSRRVAAPAPDLEAGLPPSTLPEQRRSAPSTLFSVRSLAPQQRRCLLCTLGLNVAIVGLYCSSTFSPWVRDNPLFFPSPSISGELNLVCLVVHVVWWPSDKWVMVLEVMQCTHDVFVKHGVTYWLDYRSLLGAIQHKVCHSPPFAVAWQAPHYFGDRASSRGTTPTILTSARWPPTLARCSPAPSSLTPLLANLSSARIALHHSRPVSFVECDPGWVGPIVVCR